MNELIKIKQQEVKASKDIKESDDISLMSYALANLELLLLQHKLKTKN